MKLTEKGWTPSHKPDLLRYLRDRCCSLDKWLASGNPKTKKEFEDEIQLEEHEKFFREWRSMNLEPEKYVEQLGS